MARHKRKKLNASIKVSSTSRADVPAISVIIPMYNAEKYIAECLDSLLEQTFQNFEVVVVDDCSTDNSVVIVESYEPKFNGRLRLSKTETNSGGGGYIPRNIGLTLAKGEYVYFVDADDFILLTALETLYNAAKEYSADVVYATDYYWLSKPDKIVRKKDERSNILFDEGTEDKPTLIVDDPGKILQEVLLKNHHRAPWIKLIQRKLLIENNIVFPKIIIGGDALWTFLVYANSKRFLRLPAAVYFLRRYHTDSLIKTKRPFRKYDPNLNSGFVKWFQCLKEISSKVAFLKERSDLCCQAAQGYFEYFIMHLSDKSKIQCIKDVHEILSGESVAEDDSELTTSFLSYLDNRMTDILPLISSCAVSVIISLYNYEEYVGECLDSLLAQTFTDFEVIVVDDCSTDNSFAVVESYIPKFNGRLTLTKTEKNTGGGGEPRNIGFSLSSGEYVFFMDADDAITETALEEMYTLGKKFDADTVYCERYYMSEGRGQDFKDNIHIADKKCQKPPFVKEPKQETKDMGKRVEKAIKFNYWVAAWLRLVRRDLIINNDIKFLSLVGSNDVGWSYQVMFSSKKFLIVPNICYIRRVHDKSVSFRERNVEDHVHKWMDRTIRSLKYMDTFMDKIDFFREKPQYRHKILSHFMNSDFACIADKCKGIKTYALYEIFRQNFGDYLGEQDVLVSCLCADINSKRNTIKNREKRIAELTDELSTVKAKKISSSATGSTISVIIPMYNAEEYIAECLDSLLAQTFQNFEVIVVDDCSTDNSVAIVESYAPKFNGRLKISSTKVNSKGGGYIPRNIGLKFSRGEYVYFMDADDFIAENALGTFYTSAEEYDADVVYTGAYYDVAKPNEPTITKDGGKESLAGNAPAGKPILTVDDPNKLLQSLLGSKNMPASWRKFVRRELLIENEILFPTVMTGGDFIWTINLYCHSKRFLQLDVPLYYYRHYNPESVLRKKREPKEQISYWVSAFIVWAKALEELSTNLEILMDNPEYSYSALSLKFLWCRDHITSELNGLYVKDIYEILCSRAAKENYSLNMTVAFFFSDLTFFFSDRIIHKRQIARFQERIKELEGEVKRLKGGR